MTTKKRVHELAKEYGMTGQALAAKLQQLGFPDIKGPSSTLDEAKLLIVEATLEAYGVYKAKTPAAAAEAEDTGLSLPGLVKKKKKKVSLSSFEGPSSVESAPAETPPAPEPVVTRPSGASREPAPPVPSSVVDGSVTPVVTPPEPAVMPPEPELVTAEAQEPALLEPLPAEAVELELEAPEAAEAFAEAPAELEGGPLEGGPEAEPQVAAETPSAEPASAKGAGLPEDLVRPAARRRPGKVVGFVDLSKVTTQQVPKKPDARRLRSKDDVTPDVQPTLGHDKRRALLRGDQASRGQMTAAQLREKEQARFLRRKGAPAPAPSGHRAGPRQRTGDGVSSPLAGGEVRIDAPVTVKKLAEALSIKVGQLLSRALEQNVGLLMQNSVLDDDTAGLLALEFGVTLKIQHEVHAETALVAELAKKRTAVEEGELIVRAPSIAILGHVDHGKTTLIDTIRSSHIAENESGGITQHIGAYQIQTRAGHALTIIDTPGHEAFTAMRARGADAVDIVVLVVAADDGVMPSTVEAIQHARAAKKKIVVALNKIDKPDANSRRVREQLSAEGLIPEEWGGDVAMLEASGKTGQGVEELLERVFLESEVLELKAHAKGPASGVVLEAEVQEGKGRVAHLLVKDGTLNKGDVILAGEGYGRVRSIYDDRGNEIDSAGPSMPVQVTGLSDALPTVGDSFYVVDKLEQAREVAEERRRKNRMMSLAERKQITAENIFQAVADQKKTVINVILRADVQGSLQALESQLKGLTHPEVDVKLLSSGLGTVTESDVNLAATSNGLVLAFRVGTNSEARDAAERMGVDIRPYNVIYELLDDLRQMMEGTLAPEMTEQVTGHIEVRALFKSSKFGTIAGCHVLDGAVQRDNRVRVLRGGKVAFEGAIAGLRREKDDVREVREGFDCGVTLRDFDTFELGDVLEGFKTVAVKRKLART